MLATGLAIRVVVVLWAGVALAQTQLKLVSGNDYEPYADQGQSECGVATNRVKAAFKAVGVEVQIDWKPWNRGYHEALLGKYAGTFPYIYTAKRSRDFLYSRPIARAAHYVYTRHGDSRLNGPIEQLASARSCVPLGWALPQRLIKLVAKNQIMPERPSNLAACVRMVQLNRADYLVSPSDVAIETFAKAGLAADVLERADRPIADLTLHLIVPRSNPHAEQLIQQFDMGLQKLSQMDHCDVMIDQVGKSAVFLQDARKCDDKSVGSGFGSPHTEEDVVYKSVYEMVSEPLR